MKKRSSGGKWTKVNADNLRPHTRADSARLKAAQARPVDASDIPEATADELQGRPWGPPHRARKVAVTLSLDADVAQRVQAEGTTRVNQLLRRLFIGAKRAKAG